MVQIARTKLIFAGRKNSFDLGHSAITAAKNENKQCL